MPIRKPIMVTLGEWRWLQRIRRGLGQKQMGIQQADVSRREHDETPKGLIPVNCFEEGRIRRRRLGKTQLEMAYMLGVSRQTLNRWERTCNEVYMDALRALEDEDA